VIDPSTGALGYGLEYFLDPERNQIAALKQNDTMLQAPRSQPRQGVWRAKEAKITQAERRSGATSASAASSGEALTGRR